MKLKTLVAFACLVLCACSTPYSPPMVVKGSAGFVGLADLLSPEQPLDVILVHGMCSHDADWAKDAMSRIAAALDSNIALRVPAEKALSAGGGPPSILLVRRETVVSGSMLRMTGIVWSPLTAQLKKQLEYDNTAETNDCAVQGTCKPKRAKLNRMLKDKLLNDCLSDAMAYQGASRPIMRAAMIDAFTRALADSPPNSRIVLISDSLGSKLSFDALSEMLASPAPSIAKAASGRLGQIFMNANQLPILGLADQSIPAPLGLAAVASAAAPARPADSLALFLAVRPQPAVKSNAAKPSLGIVAFTDPNDLLSYRLEPSRYASADVAVSDVLVSNQKTYFGLIERPDKAHTEYITNPEVATAIACGVPKSARCR